MKIYTIYLVFFCLIFLIFGSCSSEEDNILYIASDTDAIRDSVRAQFAGGDFTIGQTSEEGFAISYVEAIKMGSPIVGLMHRVEEEDNQIFFEDMYNSFQGLSSYDAYKKYIQTYLPLIPAIYALRENNKDMYLKFYSFMFDQVQEEGLYMDEIKQLVGDVDDDEIKQGFLNIFDQHYDTVLLEGYSFDSSFGDDPLNIAMTDDTIEKAKANCDTSVIASENLLSRVECYDYSYLYRATNENDFCDKVSDEYQKRICKGYLEYISR